VLAAGALKVGRPGGVGMRRGGGWLGSMGV